MFYLHEEMYVHLYGNDNKSSVGSIVDVKIQSVPIALGEQVAQYFVLVVHLLEVAEQYQFGVIARFHLVSMLIVLEQQILLIRSLVLVPIQWQQRLRGGMFVPNIPIHVGIAHIEEHETILYNTLRFELEESIRAYLQRTRRSYPINLVFDFSNIHQSL
ncbi:unnamed protein product [Rotaria sp. Silwood2]|nr:unnamed protein product [Rotaria sp. Silwood2]